MHVLGRPFSHNRQRTRSSKRTRDLPIRKISLASASTATPSTVASSTFASPQSAISAPSTAPSTGSKHQSPAVSLSSKQASINPAPARLSDRPLIQMVRRRYHAITGFYLPREDEFDHLPSLPESEPLGLGVHVDGTLFDIVSEQDRVQKADALDDYFSPRQRDSHSAARKRPTLMRSHWSESTIHTSPTTPEHDYSYSPQSASFTETLTPGEDDDIFPSPPALFSDDLETPEAHFASVGILVSTVVPEPVMLLPTRYDPEAEKRKAAEALVAGAPKRPPFKAASSYDAFIKRGGWKRRGIVFAQADEPVHDLHSHRRAASDDVFWTGQTAFAG